MTVVEAPDRRLVAIASRYHALPRDDATAADALSDSVVVPTLREAIVDNVLAPGSRLREVQLAAQLGVSRTPLREAFAQLEREGLVTVVPRVGVFVREVTLRDVDEIYRVRAALEGMAVDLASRNPTPLGRARLDAAVEAMRAQVEANDPAAYTRELDAFYATVMDLADNTVLHHTHANLLGPMRRLRRIAMSHAGRMNASYRQTVKIKDAIKRGDPTCVALMHEQLAKACEAAKDALTGSTR